ncbi:MAG: tetratricopeptide repeat protein [Bdellovibrionales bacterium]|nr:tetratricopeptide repeat protein [Bdellovibrionales bacterium]
MSVKSLTLMGFLFIIASCASKAPSSLTQTLLFEDAVKTESNPKRLASHQAVIQGRKEALHYRYERAAQEFSKAIEIDPENPYAYFYFAEVRSKVQRFEEAVELYSQAANYFTNNPKWKSQALTLRGEILESMTDYEKAKQSYQLALKVFSGNVRAKQGIVRLK